MTDIPAYALSSLCLLGGAIWLERGTRSALLASIAFGVLAVSVREFAVAAPGSVLLVSWLRSRKSDRVVLSLASALFAACLVFVLTVATSTGGRVTDAPDPLRLIKVGHVFLVLSAMLLPVVALRAGHWLRIVTPMQLIVGAALGCIAAVVPWGAQGGDLWMGYGVGGGGLLYGGRNPVIPPAAWLWSGQVAAFAAIALATLTVRWVLENLATVRSWSSGLAMPFRIAHAEGGLLTVFVIAYAAELVAFSPIALFDRYLFPILPAASILILSFGARTEFQFSRAVAFSNAAFAWLAVSAFLIAANAFAYDAARWRQGEIAVKMGYEAGTVDAGYEWVGYHSVGDVHLELSDFHLAWYDNFLLRQPPCVVAASTPPNGSQWHLIRVTQPAYLKFLFFGSPERLALWLADVPECLHPPQ